MYSYMFEFYLGPNGGDKGGNLAEVGDGRLDPEQVGSVLEARHAVQHHAVLCRSIPGVRSLILVLCSS